MKLLLAYKLFFFLYSLLNGQMLDDNLKNKDVYKSPKNLYVSDLSGNLSMNINIWSNTSSGRLLVPEGIDFVTLLSTIGGPIKGNNYKKITIIREFSDNNKKKIIVDMTEFIKSGDRSYLAPILPNDTIIIKRKFLYNIIDQISDLTTFITIINLIINLTNFS